ncbi:hypothetical protein [Vibrio splendidus]|uniref:hypothetical protein n=1 Tax=Vibrio splendidus TaxID=29497 RepID=UPI00080EE7F8|nr:hypothetical protein [Vibrio splendidus]OCH68729.1 hypothetical protein A6D94_04915 [Vibrio splendidus]
MSKRKPLLPQKDIKKALVEVLHIDGMVLKVPKKKENFYLVRLKYKGVPNMSPHGGFSAKTQLTDMKRDSFIREIYNLVKDEVNTTLISLMKRLAKYIRYLDKKQLSPVYGDYFHQNLTHPYLDQINKLAKTGVDESVPSNMRKMFSFFLKKQDRELEAANLPTVHQKKSGTKAYDLEMEVKPITKILFRGFNEFSRHLKDGTHPNIHPFYDRTLVQEVIDKKKSNPTIVLTKRAFQQAINPNHNKITKASSHLDLNERRVKNQLTRCAIMICFMLTGINTEPLLMMKRKDVRFKQIHGGKYLFETVKGRSNHSENDNGIGFSKRTREFVENWLKLSTLISGSDKNTWLFPYVNADGTISNFLSNSTLYTPFNKLFRYLELPYLSAQRFRQTKSDALMKVTESVYIVSMSLNNSISAVEAHYSSGQDQDHERNIAATMDAQISISKGSPVESAITESKIKFKDILSEYDYRKRLRPDSITPSGVRCAGDESLKSQIDRQLNVLKIQMPEEERKCTNFLKCFECDSHMLVALVEDIWLMMSFYDVIKSLKENSAINSIPKNDLYQLEMTIKGILERFKEKSPSNYAKARDKHSDAPHELYSDIRSMDDLLEVFG